METGALTFDNLNNTLYSFVTDFVETYKSLLIRDGKNPKGDLIRTLKPIGIEFTSNQMSGSIEIADYWKYVEYGRRPGKFPPPDAIIEWVKTRPVIPRAKNGLKPPTDKQISFLVSRKISEKGIAAGNQYTKALDICWNRWKDKIEEAVSQDIQNYLNTI
jgi:hypothetical protein